MPECEHGELDRPRAPHALTDLPELLPFIFTTRRWRVEMLVNCSLGGTVKAELR